MQAIKNFFNTIFWGNSIALSWTWGIGLFFSVQVAIQHGLKALFIFAAIDAIGLFLFGLINDIYAKKFSSADHFEENFLNKAKNFKFAFLFYQFIAVTLTLFACLKYVTLPMGILSILVCLMFVGALIFMGEEFNINRIKYSHSIYLVIMAVAVSTIASSGIFPYASLQENLSHFANYAAKYQFKSTFFEYGYWVPVAFGFFFGPWLDLQNWQKAIQIKKEGKSITQAYLIGSLTFFAILIADGLIALAAFNYDSAAVIETLAAINSNIPIDSLLFSFKSTITHVLNEDMIGFYLLFVGIGAISTFDSGYIAYKWYTESLIKDSKSIIFSFIPPNFITSPIAGFFLCTVVATISLHFAEVGKFIKRFDPSLEKFFRFELEYYLAFFASFFIIYALTFMRSIFKPESVARFSSLRLFSTALASTSLFGIGYFQENLAIMGIGSILPFVYGFFTKEKQINKNETIKAQVVETTVIENTNNTVNKHKLAGTQADLSYGTLPEGAAPASIKGCYIKEDWFVHQFVPTYQDTNSVGNIYFAMYAMWVGKTRELFFAHVIPDFDPKTSEYLILTRSYEHKFAREVREFDEVTIQVRVADFNRKFVTMEHKILDKEGQLIGNGKQSLMFVASNDYRLIDIPNSVHMSFLPYTKGKEAQKSLSARS